MQAQRELRVLPILNPNARRVCVVAISQPLCTWGNAPLPTAQAAAWVGEPDWTRWSRSLATSRFGHRNFRPIPNPYTNCALPLLHPMENRNIVRNSHPSATVHKNSQKDWPEIKIRHHLQWNGGN